MFVAKKSRFKADRSPLKRQDRTDYLTVELTRSFLSWQVHKIVRKQTTHSRYANCVYITHNIPLDKHVITVILRYNYYSLGYM